MWGTRDLSPSHIYNVDGGKSTFLLIYLEWIWIYSCLLKIWRKLDIDGRCSELSIDFYKSTSTIIEMLTIKIGTLSYLELFMKSERDRKGEGETETGTKTETKTETEDERGWTL